MSGIGIDWLGECFLQESFLKEDPLISRLYSVSCSSPVPKWPQWEPESLPPKIKIEEEQQYSFTYEPGNYEIPPAPIGANFEDGDFDISSGYTLP